MVDNKPLDKATAQHLKDVDAKYQERTEDAVKDSKKSKAEDAYEARAKAYTEGQEEIEAQRKERDAPYEKLSNLIDEHSDVERGEVEDDKPKKK